jgi:hypothetical protein
MQISRVHKIFSYLHVTTITIFLLLIAYSFFEDKKNTVQKGCIKINIRDTVQIKKEGFYTLFNGNIFPARKYTDINLSGDYKTDEIKLNFFHLRVKEIINKNDTVNGMHLIFEDSANYGEFIRAIDILRYEGASYYMAVDNHLWFIRFAKEGSR